MNNETKLKLASAGIDITEIIPADSIVVPTALWNDWAAKIEQMGNQQHATEAEPISPDAPKMERGEDRHMSKVEAIYILGKLATSRRINVDGVIALQMGARALMKRHFDRQRNWERRRAQRPHAAPSTAEQ